MIEKMFWLFKKAFITLLSFDFSSVTACVSLNNQPCLDRNALIDLNPDEYIQGLRYYPLIVNLDTCNGSCHTLDNQNKCSKQHIRCKFKDKSK